VEEARVLVNCTPSFPLTLFSADVPPPPLPDAPERSGIRRAGSQLRVLVVDDEPLIATTVTAILNDSGFEAIHAFSAEDALVAARDFCPDVVLSDVLMPRMSGVDLGMRLRQELPGAYIILFSGQAATTELLRKARLDGYDFELLAKPIHPEELIVHLAALKLPRS